METSPLTVARYGESMQAVVLSLIVKYQQSLQVTSNKDKLLIGFQNKIISCRINRLNYRRCLSRRFCQKVSGNIDPCDAFIHTEWEHSELGSAFSDRSVNYLYGKSTLRDSTRLCSLRLKLRFDPVPYGSRIQGVIPAIGKLAKVIGTGYLLCIAA